jgi:hypothetical protein
MAPSQHARKNRNYRPTEDEYDGPGKAAVEAAGHTMDNAVRAFLRWLNEDPARLALISSHLEAVKAETPRGRPKRNVNQGA